MSPGPGYSVDPYFHCPSALPYCSADSPKSNITSTAAHPALHCLRVTWCPSQQCQLSPHPSWTGGEEQTLNWRQKICILKSYVCFFPRRGTGDSEHVHHPVDAAAVLRGRLSVPRALPRTAR